METNQTDLGYINSAIDHLQMELKERLNNELLTLPLLHQNSAIILFLSIGNPAVRARVFHVAERDITKAVDKLRKKAVDLVRKHHFQSYWIKLDIVTHIQELSFEELERRIAKTRKNYFRSGIAFDDEFRLAFLEQEINGNAMIRNVKKSPLRLDEKNVKSISEKQFHAGVAFYEKALCEQTSIHFSNRSVFYGTWAFGSEGAL